MRYIYYILLLLHTLASALAQDTYSSVCENNKLGLDKDFGPLRTITMEKGFDLLYAKTSSLDAIVQAIFKGASPQSNPKHCISLKVEDVKGPEIQSYINADTGDGVMLGHWYSLKCVKDGDRKGVVKCTLSVDKNNPIERELIFVYSDERDYVHAIVVCNPKEKKYGWAVMCVWRDHLTPEKQTVIDGIFAQLGIDKDDKVEVC